jgi:hypothetical protein
MADLQTELQAIHERNKRVESEKAWETSFVRRGFIVVITYLTAAVFLSTIGIPSPWINALVPTGGYALSTLSLPWLKQWWIKKRYSRTE